jgi:hypothetical protein
MLRVTTEKGIESWRWANAKLGMGEVSDTRHKELGNAFLPIPSAIPPLVSRIVKYVGKCKEPRNSILRYH